MRHQSLLASLVLGCAIVFSGAGQSRAAYLPHDYATDEAPSIFEASAIDRDLIYETHLYCLALAVYFEGGSTGETEEGQRHIARVVVERARANRRVWGGHDLCDVVFYKRRGVCQFSFACIPVARRTPRGGPAWRFSFEIARDELEGRSTVEERLTRYYLNAALTPARNICRFRKEFVPVLRAGRHEFFREPTSEELVQLRKSEPAECKIAKAHKSKKRFAKAKKSKRYAAKAKKGKKIRYAGN